ncbi:MAG: dephospho-CoA kinase [Myxococcales bacterium]|nr:dephospho-CoA kinase [Myxococcales bacterium]
MITLGLTGGIASGKSTVAARLRQLGAAVIDADGLTRELVRPGSVALREITARFGAAVLGAGGALDRAALASIVFADDEARRELEAILHPRIWKAACAERDRLGELGYHVVFYEAALLVETGTYKQLDGLIVVTAPPEVQQRRVVARDGHAPKQAAARIAAQLPLADKVRLANWVIDNTGDEPELIRQVDALVKTLEAGFGPLTITEARGRKAPRRPAATSIARHAPVLADHYTTLIVGAPHPIALACATHLAAPEHVRVYLLSTQAAAPAMEQWAAASPFGARLTVLVGDAAHMHLGLSADEYSDLRQQLTSIVVIDETDDDDALGHAAWQGELVARQVLALATQAAAIDHVTYLSSTFVAGNDPGPYLESMAPTLGPWLFRYDEQKARVEAVYAAMRTQLPIVIARASACIDLAEDAVAQLAGNRLLAWMARHPHLPLPVPPWAQVHVVEASYVAEALAVLSRHRAAAGKTFHLISDALPVPTFSALMHHQGRARWGHGVMPLLQRLARQPRLAAHATRLARHAVPAALRPMRDTIYHQQSAASLLGPLGIKPRRAQDLVAEAVAQLPRAS